MSIKVATTIGFIVLFLGIAIDSLHSLPILDSSSGIDNETINALMAQANDTPKNLYVIKAVVYEIGILTDVGENETEIESQERVDLTFFDAHTNETHIDLGNIPIPIQTNVSGQVLTGIAPVNIGAFSSPQELLKTLPLTGSIVNITHSDTAFYQLTTSNGSSHVQILDSKEMSEAPNIGNLMQFDTQNPLLPIENALTV